MTYRKPFNIRAGMILVDIILALSLAVLFTTIITGSSIGARSVFDRAHDRSVLLDAFERSSYTASSSRPFGNDRVETDMTASSTSVFAQPVSFVRIKSRDSAHLADTAGTPLCAADFFDHAIVGSYAFLHPDAAHSGYTLEPAMISVTPIILPIGPLLPLTDLEVRDGIAYVSGDSSTASDPDLFVIDIKDPVHSKILSSINTGPGIAAIALAGARVYAAAASTAAQLHVIRMDSLDSLVLEKKYKLPPPYATATEPVGSSIFFDNGKVYLGTEKWDGDEMSIIDISNPASPIKTGSVKTGSKVNDIFVRNGVAYVADSDQKQLRRIDVSQPASPILVDSFSPSGWSRQEGKILSYFEDSLGFGRTSGGFNITTDHEAFTWTASASSTYSPENFSVYNSIDIPGGVYGMVVDRSHAYLATRQVNKEFQIFDRLLSTTTVSYSLPVAPQRLTCDGDRLYILAATAPVIYEISFN